jgi:hypothetical protein
MKKKHGDRTGDTVNVPRLALLDFIMAREFLMSRLVVTTDAQTKEEFYGFGCGDIEALHSRKHGAPGVNLFFRLRDGRVIDTFGRPHESDLALYDAPTH